MNAQKGGEQRGRLHCEDNTQQRAAFAAYAWLCIVKVNRAPYAAPKAERTTTSGSSLRPCVRHTVECARERIVAASVSVPNAWNLQLDAVDAGARGDVKRRAGVAPRHIAYHLRNFYRAQMLAFRRNDPDAARA